MESIFIITTFSLVFSSAAQAGWMRTYGGEDSDVGRYVLPQSNDTYIVLGNSSTLNGMWLLKVTSNGDTLWTQVYQGVGISLDTTSDGGYIITGGRNDSLLLLKTDSEGLLEWSRTYSQDLGGSGESVCVTSDGGYIITGAVRRAAADSALNEDLWLMKTDPEGNEEWSIVSYGAFAEVPDEGNDFDWGMSVMEVSDGGYVICGTCDAWQGFNGGKIWWFKVDSGGAVLWERTYEDGWRAFASCIRQTADGGFIITGGVEDDDDLAYLVLLKTDSSGSVEWQRDYGGYPMELGYWCEQTIDGGYVATGEYYAILDGSSSLLLLKVDENGDTSWIHTYGGEGTDLGYCVKQDHDKGYIITGYTESYGAGSNDLWLIKTDSLGYVGVEEPVTPVTPVTHLEIFSTIGSTVSLRYSNCAGGFRASVFDASGRKVDELKSPGESGVLSWGECYGPGVYFIVSDEGSSQVSKVILIR